MRPALKQAVDREWPRRATSQPDEGGERRAVPTEAPPTAVSEGQTQRRRLSDFLLAEGLITTEQLAQILAEQKRTNEKFPVVVVRMGLMTEDQMVDAQSRHYRIPFVVFPEGGIPPEILRLVPSAIAIKHEVVPIGRSAGALTLAMVDPTNLSAVDDVAFRTGMRVFPVIARPSIIRQAIEQFYEEQKATLAAALSDAEAEAGAASDAEEQAPNPLDLRASADHAPVVRLVNMIILEAIARGASDIHLEPGERNLQVRFRVDGVLQDVMSPAKRLEPAVVSRIKIMASLDIAERRLPQDGRIKFRDATHEIDFRVSVIPALYGESVVLRLLDKSALKLDLTQLGFDTWSLEQFQTAIRNPHGMILVTGPTGSGKTTTLYSVLQTVNSSEIHILTLEDPVEYNIPRVNQVQVNEEIGFGFATALRSFLRHDPDVILVGEMRDLDTAQIANRAALTGHLVLSTLHTNDAPSTVTRLIDMGIPPFLLGSSLRLIVAQRLARKICEACREPCEGDEADLVAHGLKPQGRGAVTLYRGAGCATCSYTGLKGRVALYEVLPITREIRELVVRGADAGEIKKVARDIGMLTLREAGLMKVLEGVTTVEEVLRVTAE
ncbi:MAG TPA: ATPase, T2SS/T4P/T4SS family [Candidatus Binatia bacterium]|nr:ATPase, T2SS/T4P/T4SS family [Candidatus Binatia bacterium]